MINEVEAKILQIVSKEDYEAGLKYDEDAIFMYSPYVNYNGKHFPFSVDSEAGYLDYEVEILLKGGKIFTECDCPKFRRSKSCCHVAACLISYSDYIFAMESNESIKKKSLTFLENLTKNYKAPTITGVKKALKLEPFLKIDIHSSMWGTDVNKTLKVKIGETKMYSLNTKFRDFIEAYKAGEKFSFGKDFEYDPDKHFLAKKEEELLLDVDQIYHRSPQFNLDDQSFVRFIQANKNGYYLEYSTKPRKLKEGLFFASSLSKVENNYKLDLNFSPYELCFLTDDKSYVYYNFEIYHLNADEQKLLVNIINNDIEKLIFTEKQFEDFKKVFLPYIKNNITIDESVTNLKISKEPTASFYFDILEDQIEANIIFNYDGYEVEWNSNNPNEPIVRDKMYENKVLEVLFPYDFVMVKDKIVLEGYEKIVDFIENSIEEISLKYPVYTSERLKALNIVRKPRVTSTFHLGVNQILNYHLEVDGIDETEIKNLFASLKQRKKYYRLKNGDLLDMSSEEIQELNRLQEDLELDDFDGKIPKFRALYLDSLKDHSHIINTDNSFDKFINQFKEYQNIDLEFTKEEKEMLRDYQVDGVRWLYTIYKCGFGGILADEMGLGKSFQTIVFIKKILEKDDKILIVSPTSLVYNWEAEFDKFGPELSYQVFSGNKIERKKALEEYQGNIYITSYGLLKEDFDFYEKENFKLFIIDEAQAIKNPVSDVTKTVKKIEATAKFALTGTPIENSLLELWSIFDFIMPGFLANANAFNQKYKIKEDFDEDTNNLLARLKMQIKPFLLRRKKMDVAKDLPEKIENNIYVDLEEEQKKIYAGAVAEANKLMEEAIQSGGFKKNQMIILSLLTRLRQICIDPRIVYKNYTKKSSKIEELIKVVKEVIDNGHKLLLFTNFRTALDIVKDEFEKNKISYYMIAGDVPAKKRKDLVDNFNKDNTNAFLIMLKSGGTGLNLTSADVVIHLDLWWNPQAENQATDRTHRIGQTNTVTVVKIITKNTIEERILELQERKKILSDKLIEDGTDEAAYFRSLTEEDIRELLRYENEEAK